MTAKRQNGRDYLGHEGLNLHDRRRSAIRNTTRRGVGTKTAITDEADLIQASELIENRGPQPQVKTDTSAVDHL